MRGANSGSQKTSFSALIPWYKQYSPVHAYFGPL